LSRTRPPKPRGVSGGGRGQAPDQAAATSAVVLLPRVVDTNNSLHTIRAFFERAYSVPNLLQNYFNAEKAQSPSWCHSGEGAFSTYAATCSKRMVVSNA